MGGLQYNVPNVVLLLFRNLSIPRGICPIVQDTYFDLLCFLGRSVRDDLCLLLVLPFFFFGGEDCWFNLTVLVEFEIQGTH